MQVRSIGPCGPAGAPSVGGAACEDETPDASGLLAPDACVDVTTKDSMTPAAIIAARQTGQCLMSVLVAERSEKSMVDRQLSTGGMSIGGRAWVFTRWGETWTSGGGAGTYCR